MSTFRYPSATNHLPVLTQYVISYARQPKDFGLNRYTQYVPAPAQAFYYYTVSPDQAVRMREANLHVWADGADRPMRQDNHFPFTTTQAFTVRYDHNVVIGNDALEVANEQWKAKTVYLQGLASQAMTLRTKKVIDMLETAANWPTYHKNDANTLNGGFGTWDEASGTPGDPHYMAISKTLNAAVQQIHLDTNGRVKFEDLRLVISPNVANAIANSAEFNERYKYGPYAADFVEKNEENFNTRFGIPKRLYGIEVVVEDAMYISDPPDAGATSNSTARVRIKSDDSAILVSRPGGVDAQVGPSFSTTQLYWWNDQMTVEEFVDPINRRTSFHIVQNFVPVLPAGTSGYLITNILS